MSLAEALPSTCGALQHSNQKRHGAPSGCKSEMGTWAHRGAVGRGLGEQLCLRQELLQPQDKKGAATSRRPQSTGHLLQAALPSKLGPWGQVEGSEGARRVGGNSPDADSEDRGLNTKARSHVKHQLLDKE